MASQDARAIISLCVWDIHNTQAPDSLGKATVGLVTRKPRENILLIILAEKLLFSISGALLGQA